VRVISHSPYLAHSDPLFNSLNILKVYDLTHLAVLTFMYRAINNLLPKKFSNFLRMVNQVHLYNTRNSMNYVLPYARTGYRTGSIQIVGPRIWNSLPNEFKEIKHICTFKREMKKHIC